MYSPAIVLFLNYSKMTETSTSSFTLSYYRMNASRSFWDLVYLFEGRTEKWLNSHGYDTSLISQEEVETPDGEHVNIIYKTENNKTENNKIDIFITIISNQADNCIYFSESSTVDNEEDNRSLHFMFRETSDKVISDHKQQEHNLEEEFQEECRIEYARDHI